MRHVVLIALALLLAAAHAAGPAGAAGFVVNSTGDGADVTIDGVCNAGGGACTLRAAIQEANATPTVDTIGFSVASGLQTISPASPLPEITQPVTIDGRTQPGYSGKPIIEIDGTIAGSNPSNYAYGFWIAGGTSTIRGLIINNFPGEAIVLIGDQAGNNVIAGNYIGTDATGTQARGNAYGVWIFGSTANVIGGTTPDARNVISGNFGAGLLLWDLVGQEGNVIEGNYIGSDYTGTADVGNTRGVELHNGGTEPGYLIGGSARGAGNLISGNDETGIYLFGAKNNVIQGNLIGTNLTGAAPLGNGGDGISLLGEADNNLIGGSTAGVRNVISGNAGNGIFISNTSPNGNQIIGNYIGSGITGLLPLGNAQDGIHVGGPTGDPWYSQIGGTSAGEGNLIAFNGSNGIYIGVGYGAMHTTVRGNSIHTNGLLGIDNFDAVIVAPAPPTITGLGPLTGTSLPDCAIDLYSDAANEGRVYYGSTIANGAGTWSYVVPVGGPNITATCTDTTGSTSEFSAPFASGCVPGDADCDSVPDASDNCPSMPNPSQGDLDADGFGDACDAGPSGDVDCSGTANSVDALKVLRHTAGLPVQQNHPCVLIGNPQISGWQQGDVNCSGGANSVDALIILRAISGLGVSLPPGCPPIKEPGA